LEAVWKFGILAALLVMTAVMAYSATARKKINDRGGCPECNTPVPAVGGQRRCVSSSGAVGPVKNAEPEMDRQGCELTACDLGSTQNLSERQLNPPSIFLEFGHSQFNDVVAASFKFASQLRKTAANT
jgi:hypothetical protein